MTQGKIYTTTLVGRWKKPHLIYDEGINQTDIATLNVTPDEFYEKLGKALGIKFVDSMDANRQSI